MIIRNRTFFIWVIANNTAASFSCFNNIFTITHPGDKGDVYIEEIAKVAKDTDTRLEINSSHGFLNSSQLVKIKDIGNKFIIGSDAHIPQNVGNFDLAMKIIKEARLDTSLVENIKL